MICDMKFTDSLSCLCSWSSIYSIDAIGRDWRHEVRGQRVLSVCTWSSIYSIDAIGRDLRHEVRGQRVRSMYLV